MHHALTGSSQPPNRSQGQGRANDHLRTWYLNFFFARSSLATPLTNGNRGNHSKQAWIWTLGWHWALLRRFRPLAQSVSRSLASTAHWCWRFESPDDEGNRSGHSRRAAVVVIAAAAAVAVVVDVPVELDVPFAWDQVIGIAVKPLRCCRCRSAAAAAEALVSQIASQIKLLRRFQCVVFCSAFADVHPSGRAVDRPRPCVQRRSGNSQCVRTNIVVCTSTAAHKLAQTASSTSSIVSILFFLSE